MQLSPANDELYLLHALPAQAALHELRLCFIKVSCSLPSVLWHCWLGVRKSIRPVGLKIWVMRCWRGYRSEVRCKRFAYGTADATATPSSLAFKKNPD